MKLHSTFLNSNFPVAPCGCFTFRWLCTVTVFLLIALHSSFFLPRDDKPAKTLRGFPTVSVGRVAATGVRESNWTSSSRWRAKKLKRSTEKFSLFSAHHQNNTPIKGSTANEWMAPNPTCYCIRRKRSISHKFLSLGLASRGFCFLKITCALIGYLIFTTALPPLLCKTLLSFWAPL